jgi:hypothetical protein
MARLRLLATGDAAKERPASDANRLLLSEAADSKV